MTPLLARRHHGTSTAGSGFADLDVDLADDLSDAIGSYSDLFLLQAALRRARASAPRNLYFYASEPTSTPQFGSQTAITADPVLQNFRAVVQTILASVA